MSDSTKSDNIDQLDAGSARWQLKTHYRSTTDVHSPEVVSIDSEHQMIHEGRGFTASGEITALGDSATAYLLAKNTNGTPVHWRIASFSVDDAPVRINFYEAPTVSANGTQLTTYNKNRASAATSVLDVYSGPTVTNVGTGPIEFNYIPSAGGASGSGPGPGGNTDGAAARTGGEWILDVETDYLVAVTNNSGGAINVGYYFFWYEE